MQKIEWLKSDGIRNHEPQRKIRQFFGFLSKNNLGKKWYETLISMQDTSHYIGEERKVALALKVESRKKI